ncbi:HNH endonuclease [Vibrio alginolyticus]
MGKKMSKRRQAIFDKSNGVCWYCGDPLANVRWHEDHFFPIRRNGDGTCMSPELDVEENKVPSCAPCNKLKSSLPLEIFRDYIYNFIDSLNKYTNQYKFAKRYGQLQENRHPVVFWFEKNKKKVVIPGVTDGSENEANDSVESSNAA